MFSRRDDACIPFLSADTGPYSLTEESRHTNTRNGSEPGSTEFLPLTETASRLEKGVGLSNPSFLCERDRATG